MATRLATSGLTALLQFAVWSCCFRDFARALGVEVRLATVKLANSKGPISGLNAQEEQK